MDFRQVNGIDITVAPHDQAVALLTGIRGEISLVVSRDQSDVTPQPTTHGAVSTVTWPTTPLDAGTELPIIVQPPTPNYAVVESPRPSDVVKDATDVATDSFVAADVESGAVAEVGGRKETAETDADLTEPLSIDLIDLSAAACEAVTSRDDDVTTLPRGDVLEVDVRTRELMSLAQFDEFGFDIDDDFDDDDDDVALAATGVAWSPMSSDIRDMIQHGMLETLRLL